MYDGKVSKRVKAGPRKCPIFQCVCPDYQHLTVHVFIKHFESLLDKKRETILHDEN